MREFVQSYDGPDGHSGLAGYAAVFFASDVVVDESRRIARVVEQSAATSSSSATVDEQRGTAEKAADDRRSSGTSAAATVVFSAAPPPPVPPPSHQRIRRGSLSGDGSGLSFYATPAAMGRGTGGGATASGGGGVVAEAAVPIPLRSTIQIMDALVEYIPTSFVPVDQVSVSIPSEIQRLYSDASFAFFLKRFRHYVDLRTMHGNTEVRLRPTFDHPKRGVADGRFGTGGGGLPQTSIRRPPRNSEASLIGLVVPQMPKEYTPIAAVLQDTAGIISRHPAFDPRLGVTGLLEKYPEYFQMVGGRLRVRPYRTAPNSIDDLDATTSPLPAIFAKIYAEVTAAAAGKTFSVAAEKAAATVSTGRLYSLLTAEEKVVVKQQCRSFPTFLRMHGGAIVVSMDKMRVHLFFPEHEACADTILDERLRMNAISPDDPVLRIPAEMTAEANADWAVRELYDALPLMQCAELAEILVLVPGAVRDALPKAEEDVVALLTQHPDYFSVWRYPDDPSTFIVQRAKVEEPVLDDATIVRMVVPLIPQGGTTLTSLRTRVPLSLQRYFHRHGVVMVLGKLKDVFLISNDRIVRIA